MKKVSVHELNQPSVAVNALGVAYEALQNASIRENNLRMYLKCELMLICLRKADYTIRMRTCESYPPVLHIAEDSDSIATINREIAVLHTARWF